MKSFINFLSINLIFTWKAVFSDSLFVEEPPMCQTYLSSSPMNRLKNHIFCDNQPIVPPNKYHQNITANIVLIPKTMDYDSGSNKFTLNSLMQFDWIDENLKWNPKDFNQISEIHVTKDQIWIPDLSIWNSADFNLLSVMSFSSKMPCLVVHTGFVICAPVIETTVQCSSDFENWPFEKQVCKIIFSSFFRHYDRIHFNRPTKKVIINRLEPHQEWSVVNVTVKSKKDSTNLPALIIYEFHLKRHPGVMFTLYVVPLLVLMMFTLTILWMDVNSMERISLISLNFMSHLLCLYDLQWQLAENGNRIPFLVTLYMNSFIMCGCSMVLTVFLRKLNAIPSSPKWISSVTYFALKYQIVKLFILDSEETKCFVENEENPDENNLEYISKTGPKNVWKHFAKILECTYFLIIFLEFIIMLFTYMPK